MNLEPIYQYSLNPNTAKNLSNSTISVPMMESITPRWLLTFLSWVPVEAGIYRLNKVKKYYDVNENDGQENTLNLKSFPLGENDISINYPDYDDRPKEYILNSIQTILRVNIQTTDLFNSPIDQMHQQMRLAVEGMQEQEEWEIINNREYGLVNSVAPSMRIQSRSGAPTPDDMDELLARVWKKPAYFLAHPRAIASFGRECTRRGVPPVIVNLYGSPFLTWRGVPIIPCDKLLIDGKTSNPSMYGKTNILLMRVGERDQGVIGMYQPGLPNELNIPSLSMRFAGIDDRGIAAYLMSLYFGTVVLTDDALGMLENVEVGQYYD